MTTLSKSDQDFSDRCQLYMMEDEWQHFYFIDTKGTFRYVDKPWQEMPVSQIHARIEWDERFLATLDYDSLNKRAKGLVDRITHWHEKAGQDLERVTSSG